MSKITSNVRNQFAFKNEILIFLFLFIISTSIVTYQYFIWETSEERIKHKSLALFSGDEPFYLEMTSSIVRNQTFALDAHFTSTTKDPFFEFPPLFYQVHSCRLHHSLMASDNHCYITNVGLPLIISPGYYLGGVVGSMLTLSMLFSIQGIIFYKIANHYATKNSSFLLAILVSLSTTILIFAPRIYPEFISGFFLLGAIYFFFFRENNFLNIVITGFFLGFLPLIKSLNLLFPIILLPIMIYLLLKKRYFNNAFQLSIVFSILFLIFFSLMISFAPVETAPGLGGGYKEHFVNILSNSSLNQLSTSLIHGFERHFFGQDYGLLVYSPLALLSIFGIKYIWSDNKSIFFAIFLPVSIFAFFIAIFLAYSGGWSLPGRYIFPILPILLIPLFPIFEKFKKNIILHLIILFSVYVGVSVNIIVSRTIYAHFIITERNNILNFVYFGISSVFPYLAYDKDASYQNNFFTISYSPIFLIFTIVLISIFIFFTFSSTFKKFYKTKVKKIIFFIIAFVIYGSIFFYTYDVTSNYYVESEISDIFYEILKRQPTNEEDLYWKSLLINERFTLDQIRDSLLESDEGIITTTITEIYQEVLHREPDVSGMIHWKEKIINKEITFSELKDTIKNSSEALN